MPPPEKLRAESSRGSGARAFSASFSGATTFSDERLLREAFGADLLFLDEGATVILEGRISLGPNVSFAGRCEIGDGCRIDAGSLLEDVVLAEDNHVRPHSILTRVRAGPRNLFGPFCFVRDDCRVQSECILGAHVEAARSCFGDRVKVSHRAFIGDAEIGDDTIVGAGVVFCNFDRGERRRTSVGSAVTIGSGTMLVAPLEIAEGATIGAGSVVTKDIPRGATVIQKRAEPGR